MRFWEEEILSHTWLAFAIKSKNSRFVHGFILGRTTLPSLRLFSFFDGFPKMLEIPCLHTVQNKL